MAQTVSVRQCTPDEAAEYFYQWPVQEQWNPGTHGYDLRHVFYKSDAEGFFVGTIADSESPSKEKVVAIVSAVRYGEDSGWVGFYIVAPEHRGRGYGQTIFRHALAHMENRPCIGLDAVLQQVENYKASGFTIVSWENQRRSGNLYHIIEKLSSYETLENATIDDASKVPLDQLNAFELRYNGWERASFVENWINFHSNNADHGRFCVAVMDNERVLGYGCVRPAITSFRVGPLFAESNEVAKTILYNLAKSVSQVISQPDNHIAPSVMDIFDVDVCIANAQAVAMFDDLDMANTFSTLRMWKGKQPKVDVDGIYGVTTLEVG
jgi:GNAT superfamily N-acetyltransferase